jgi:hypothetical protein
MLIEAGLPFNSDFPHKALNLRENKLHHRKEHKILVKEQQLCCTFYSGLCTISAVDHMGNGNTYEPVCMHASVRRIRAYF